MSKRIAAITAFFLGLFWLIRRSKDLRPPEDNSDNKEPIAKEQAAVIASTWTILHPPF
jgi:hypothetical protein